jgi:hypothetical protein
MPRCFVIQPFDKGKFDKRYDSTFRPAIEAAGLDPYRVDRDPGVAVPIADIEAGIRGATICFADITTDNPNVWFELGFAVAERIPMVLVCSDERKTDYPFDIRHRAVIAYVTESAQDYEELATKITKKLAALLAKDSTLEAAAHPSPLRPVEGLEPQEIVALVAVAENLEAPDDVVTVQNVRTDMERAGFTRVAMTLALRVLLEQELVVPSEIQGWNETYRGYSLTTKGFQWLIDNKKLLTLRMDPNPPPTPADDDDIPF